VEDFQGAVKKTVRQGLLLKGNSSAVAFEGPAADLLAGAKPETTFLHATLTAGGSTLAEDILYFRPVKDLALPNAPVATKISDMGGAFAIALTSPALVKNLHLSLDDTDGFFSDNYFDLLPGKPAIVHFQPAKLLSARALESGLKLMHMALVS
jgi:beta-mannosidase